MRIKDSTSYSSWDFCERTEPPRVQLSKYMYMWFVFLKFVVIPTDI